MFNSTHKVHAIYAESSSEYLHHELFHRCVKFGPQNITPHNSVLQTEQGLRVIQSGFGFRISGGPDPFV